MELTSSHLVFCSHAARVAAVTSFWADHVELHGSVAAYAQAKRSLFEAQDAACIAVVPSDDAAAQQLVDGAGEARRAWWSTDASASTRRGPAACWVEEDSLHARDDAGGSLQIALAQLPAWARQAPALRSVACAVATSIAAIGAADPRLGSECMRLAQPPHRGTPLLVNTTHGLVRLADATLAATPRKARELLQPGDWVLGESFGSVRRLPDRGDRNSVGRCLAAHCRRLGSQAPELSPSGSGDPRRSVLRCAVPCQQVPARRIGRQVSRVASARGGSEPLRAMMERET